MKHVTAGGERFNTREEAIEDVRVNQLADLQPKGDRIPVIIQTILPLNISYGVQYWTEEMIAAGNNTNSDGSIASFIERGNN